MFPVYITWNSLAGHSNVTSSLLKAFGRKKTGFLGVISIICFLKPSLLITTLSAFLYMCFSMNFKIGQNVSTGSFSISLTLSGHRSLISKIFVTDLNCFWKKNVAHGRKMLGEVTYTTSNSF